MKKILTLLIMALSLNSCMGTGKIFSEKSVFAPKPLRMGKPDMKNASPEYVKGWDDGCETGLSTMVTDYYKSFYTYKMDPYMIDNATYFKAWNDSYTYCRQYSFRYSWDSYDRQGNKALENQLCIICPNELDRQQ